MGQLNNLIVKGSSRFLNDINVNGKVTATSVVPLVDNTYQLGNNAYRYTNIYTMNMNAYTMISSPYYTATTPLTLTGGRVSTLPTGNSQLYANGLVISNPGTSGDQGWLRVVGSGESDTVLEIATGDDGGAGEQIVARQYNTANTIVNEATLLDKSGNTKFPKNITSASIRLLGTVPLNNAWDAAYELIGADGKDKLVLGYLNSATNGPTIGVCNSATTAWAGLNIAASNINFRIGMGQTVVTYIGADGNVTANNGIRIGGTAGLNSAWDSNQMIVGADGKDKLVFAYCNSSTNQPTIAAHNSALTSWAGLNIAGSSINFRIGETIKAYLDSTGLVMSSPVNFVNGQYNKVGDDVSFGDINVAGTLGIKGLNGPTGIQLVRYGGSSVTDGVRWTCTANGASTITGVTTFTNSSMFNVGATFIGTAAAAGLKTRGVSGLNPEGTEKDALYLNFDDNELYTRKVYLGGQTDGAIAVRKDMLNTAISDINIGGRNLFGFNKGIRIDTASWNNALAWSQSIQGFILTTISSAISTAGILRRISNLGFNGVNGDYTLSAYVKASTSIRVKIDMCDEGGLAVDLTTTEKRIVITANIYRYNTSSSYNGFIDIESLAGYNIPANTVITFRDVKIERGTKATDWTPAPEDKADYNHTHTISDITNFVDNKVLQTNSSTNKNYRLMLSNTDGDGAETAGLYKTNKILANPSTGNITATTFTGTATKATQDGNGNTITTTYRRTSEAALTPNIAPMSNVYWEQGNILTYDGTNGDSTDYIRLINFASLHTGENYVISNYVPSSMLIFFGYDSNGSLIKTKIMENITTYSFTATDIVSFRLSFTSTMATYTLANLLAARKFSMHEGTEIPPYFIYPVTEDAVMASALLDDVNGKII